MVDVNQKGIVVSHPSGSLLNTFRSSALLASSKTTLRGARPAMVRVLLAVTHDLLRTSLQEHLLLPGEVMCGEAANLEQLWNQLSHHEWHVLILDMSLPQQTKLQTVRSVHELYPAVPILAISFSLDIGRRHWEEAGASGFVSKAKLATELPQAIRIISRGGTYFSSEGPEETIT